MIAGSHPSVAVDAMWSERPHGIGSITISGIISLLINIFMIIFEKNIGKVLPYDRVQYIGFLNEDIDSTIKWYGVSFQRPESNDGKEIDLIKFVEAYGRLFQKVLLEFNCTSFWVVNHDDKDLNWFPIETDNLTDLRALFKENHIPNTYKGALVFSIDALLEFYKDIISYPYAVLNEKGFLYKNLDVSNSELAFIIKISGHLCIDFLSTDKELLEEVINENLSEIFIVKEYRGALL